MISTLVPSISSSSVYGNSTSTTASIIEPNYNNSTSITTTNYYLYDGTLDPNNNFSYGYGAYGNDSAGYLVLPGYIRITSMVFCIVIMCLGVIGNVMVPIVIFKTKDMRNSTNIFLVNLSVADLMVLLVCTPTVLVEVNTPPESWVLGEEMCKFIFVFSFFLYLEYNDGNL